MLIDHPQCMRPSPACPAPVRTAPQEPACARPVTEDAMPTYEYACPNCGIVEVFQSIKEDALTKCPTCKKAKVQRMISVGAGIIFKGSGFWETDYNRSADYQKKSKEVSADSSSTEGVSQPKTQSQPKKADGPGTSAAPNAPNAPAGASDSAKPVKSETSTGGDKSKGSQKPPSAPTKPPGPPKR